MLCKFLSDIIIVCVYVSMCISCVCVWVWWVVAYLLYKNSGQCVCYVWDRLTSYVCAYFGVNGLIPAMQLNSCILMWRHVWLNFLRILRVMVFHCFYWLARFHNLCPPAFPFRDTGNKSNLFLSHTILSSWWRPPSQQDDFLFSKVESGLDAIWGC